MGEGQNGNCVVLSASACSELRACQWAVKEGVDGSENKGHAAWLWLQLVTIWSCGSTRPTWVSTHGVGAGICVGAGLAADTLGIPMLIPTSVTGHVVGPSTLPLSMALLATLSIGAGKHFLASCSCVHGLLDRSNR